MIYDFRRDHGQVQERRFSGLKAKSGRYDECKVRSTAMPPAASAAYSSIRSFLARAAIARKAEPSDAEQQIEARFSCYSYSVRRRRPVRPAPIAEWRLFRAPPTGREPRRQGGPDGSGVYGWVCGPHVASETIVNPY